MRTIKWTKALISSCAIVMLLMITGCSDGIAKTYDETDENNSVMKTYYEMEDGTWVCDDVVYPYRLELVGRTPNAVKDGRYVVLTNNAELTFDEVAKSLFSSSSEDTKIMEGSVIVEME